MAMTMDEVKRLLARYETNAQRIGDLRFALKVLAPDNDHAHAVKVTVAVRQGTVDRVPSVSAPASFARPLFETELSALEREQAEIEKRVGAL